MELNICLLGGGTRLTAHLGAVRGIEEQGGCISGWAGASAGSLVAAVLAGGFTHEMAVDLMATTDYRQFLDVRPIGLIRGYGLCAGRRFEKWLDGVLEGKRFCDLETHLAVICTDIKNGEPFIFSNETTPDAKVATSVRCSIGIPGVFVVRRLYGSVLIDGSLATVDDEMLFPGSFNETVSIRLVRNQTAKLKHLGKFGLSTYVQRIAGMLLDAADEPSISGDKWNNTLLVRTGQHSSVNFDLSAEERQELYDMGYEQCLKFLRLRDQALSESTSRSKMAANEYQSFEDLAEEAVRLACDVSRSNSLRRVEGQRSSIQPTVDQQKNAPHPAASGFGFEAL